MTSFEKDILERLTRAEEKLKHLLSKEEYHIIQKDYELDKKLFNNLFTKFQNKTKQHLENLEKRTKIIIFLNWAFKTRKRGITLCIFLLLLFTVWFAIVDAYNSAWFQYGHFNEIFTDLLITIIKIINNNL